LPLRGSGQPTCAPTPLSQGKASGGTRGAAIEVISFSAFDGCAQLRKVIYEANSHLREIDGFWDCSALSRFVIPSSVEKIAMSAFFRCAQFQEVIFEANSHIREIHGFSDCSTLSRIVIPSSVELITVGAFRGYSQSQEVIFKANSHLREIAGFGKHKALKIPTDRDGNKMGWTLSRR
jgi:hypothetical protein